MDSEPCIYTGPGISALDRSSYLVSNGFTCESDPVWNCTDSSEPMPEWTESKWNRTALMSYKLSLKMAACRKELRVESIEKESAV